MQFRTLIYELSEHAKRIIAHHIITKRIKENVEKLSK